MMIDATYHIYLNNTCIKACLNKHEFDEELKGLHAFLELTNLDSDATIEYVVCEPPLYETHLGEPSF